MMIWYIIESVVNFFQFYIIYKIFDLYYEKRFKFKYSVELIIIIMTMLLSILNYIIPLKSNPFLYIVFYFFIYASTVVIFKNSALLKVATFFLLVTVLGICELLSAVLVSSLTGINLHSIQEQSLGRLEVMILSQTLFFFIYVLLKKKYNKDQKKVVRFVNNKYGLLVVSILVLTVFIIVIIIFLYGQFSEHMDIVNIYMVLLTVLVSLLAILSITLTNSIIKEAEEKHKNEIELQQIKMENKYFSDVNSALEEIRILRHDMRGELAIIHAYNELNQKDNIRNHIEKKLNEMNVQLVPQIDNDNMITSFLNFKVKEAQDKGINVEIQTNIEKNTIIHIDKEDLCRIINNIMNNAIEANQKCDEKYIKILFTIENDSIFIESENPFNGEVLNEGDQILTTKKDKTKHGYGLKSIKGIAEKYNGHLFIDYDDNEFFMEVNLLNKI